MKKKLVTPDKIVAIHILKFANGKFYNELIDYYKVYMGVKDEVVNSTISFLESAGRIKFDRELLDFDGTYNNAKLIVVNDEITKSLVDELSKQ